MTEPILFPGNPCSFDEELICGFVRGQLAPDVAATVGAHLSRCRWCQECASFEELRPTLAPMRQLRIPDGLLDDFVEEVVSAAAASAPAPAWTRTRGLDPGGALSRAAAVLFAAFALAALLSRAPVTPERLVRGNARTSPHREPLRVARQSPLATPPVVVAVKTPVDQILFGQGGPSNVVMLVLEGDEEL